VRSRQSTRGLGWYRQRPRRRGYEHEAADLRRVGDRELLGQRPAPRVAQHVDAAVPERGEDVADDRGEGRQVVGEQDVR
jgi:hypothetical protein